MSYIHVDTDAYVSGLLMLKRVMHPAREERGIISSHTELGWRGDDRAERFAIRWVVFDGGEVRPGPCTSEIDELGPGYVLEDSVYGGADAFVSLYCRHWVWPKGKEKLKRSWERLRKVVLEPREMRGDVWEEGERATWEACSVLVVGGGESSFVCVQPQGHVDPTKARNQGAADASRGGELLSALPERTWYGGRAWQQG